MPAFQSDGTGAGMGAWPGKVRGGRLVEEGEQVCLEVVPESA